MSQQNEGEHLSLERLRETTAGESSVRQLRRRYDLLRRDYEVLLDRLAELEARLSLPASSADPEPAQAPPQPPPAPQPPPRAPSLREQLLAPLLQVRDEYAELLATLQSIVGGLDRLTQGTMKGQRSSAAAEAAERPSGEPATPYRQVDVEVRGSGFGTVLDFQERLAALPGVARVSIHSIDSEHATFSVELEPEG